jgi:hypothetical protein
VPSRDWVIKLQEIADTLPEEIKELHALKILDFYEMLGDSAGYLGYDVAHTEEVLGAKIPVVGKGFAGVVGRLEHLNSCRR